LASPLLIIGASGGTGVELVRQALAQHYCVTALVRAAWRSPATHPRLRVVVGDVMTPSSLDDAMASQAAVLCALGHHRYYSRARVLSAGTRNLIEAMHRHGVQRLICETSLGVGDSWWELGLYYSLLVKPLLAPRYFRDKACQEAGRSFVQGR
jgi:putative NADH-flavin reductase